MPAMVRTALHAAGAASIIGAACLAILFTILNLAFGLHEVLQGHLKLLELPAVFLGGAVIFVLALFFGFVIAVPVTSVIAACTFPFPRILRAADRRTFGIVGFLIGVLVWFGLVRNGPTGNLYFGSAWISPWLVGGPAGLAGGLAFARHLPKESDLSPES